jgi:hypothetical protein
VRIRKRRKERLGIDNGKGKKSVEDVYRSKTIDERERATAGIHATIFCSCLHDPVIGRGSPQGNRLSLMNVGLTCIGKCASSKLMEWSLISIGCRGGSEMT